MPRSFQYRTLRSDFIDLCDGNRIAALLLDYFWQQGQKLIERQANGSHESGFIPLSWAYAISVVLWPVGKNTVKRSVALLIERGFITPHPENGQWAADITNRYRPNMPVIQAEANRWSQSTAYVWPDLTRSSQTNPLVQPDLPTRSSQTNPLGLAGPYESVLESVLESPPQQGAAAALDEFIQLIGDLLGRHPNKPQQKQIGDLLTTYPPDHIRAAIDIAAANDKRSLAYVAGVLKNGSAAPASNGNGHSAPVARQYFTAPPPEPPLTPDEIARIKAELAATRASL